MAAGDLARSFQDKVTCPLCLEYFTDPVITDCGHNFCRAFLSRCWRESEPNFSCPQCRETALQRHLRPNRQLGNLVELVKHLRLPAGPAAEGQPGCERHQEALKLFCEEAQAPICVVCNRSWEHCTHTVVPIEEAAQEYKDVKSMLSRSENMKLQEPEAVSTDLQRGDKICLDLREALNRFAVDVTLDLDTAAPWLVLSEDQKCVKFRATRQVLPDTPERFDPCVCVLGAERFTGGRRYWEVEVGDKTGWTLGVCRESVSRKGNVIYTPKNGYWVMWLRDREHEALTSTLTCLPMSSRPSRVGIFLDYKAGEVSFYNVTDRSHLFTFTDTFSGMLCPFFSPYLNTGGTNTAPLTICPVPAQAGGNPCP